MIDRDIYESYLQSQEWADRRQQVMQRAEGICEGRRRRRATEVHHLSYAHVTQEFLFELVAMCGECHARWHDKTPRPAAKWTPRHTGRLPADPSPSEQSTQKRLSVLAIHARAKFMAKPLPELPAPTADQVAELAKARREGTPPPEHRDIPEGAQA